MLIVSAVLFIVYFYFLQVLTLLPFACSPFWEKGQTS